VFWKIPLIMAGFVFLLSAKEKPEDNVAQKAEMIVKTINKYHYKSRVVDDSLSSLIFDLYLKMLDPYGCYLTEEIVNLLDRYRYLIDDQISGKKSNFVDTVALIYRKQLRVVDSLVQIIGKSELNLNRTIY